MLHEGGSLFFFQAGGDAKAERGIAKGEAEAAANGGTVDATVGPAGFIKQFGGDLRGQGEAEKPAAVFGDLKAGGGFFVGDGPGALERLAIGFGKKGGFGVGGEIFDVDAGDEVIAAGAEFPLAFADGDMGAAAGTVDGGGAQDAVGPGAGGDGGFGLKAEDFAGCAGVGGRSFVNEFGISVDAGGREIDNAGGFAVKTGEEERADFLELGRGGRGAGKGGAGLIGVGADEGDGVENQPALAGEGAEGLLHGGRDRVAELEVAPGGAGTDDGGAGGGEALGHAFASEPGTEDQELERLHGFSFALKFGFAGNRREDGSGPGGEGRRAG